MTRRAPTLGSWKRGLVLLKESFGVLVNQPKLLVFPLLAGVSALAFLAVLFGSSLGVIIGVEGLDIFDSPEALQDALEAHLLVVLGTLFVAYLSTTFLSVFFTGALVAETRRAFAGEQVRLRRGMGVAWHAKYKLLAWALIAATVGVILDAIESDERFGRVLSWVFGAVWSVITFFVVPVAVLDENSTVRSMFTESGRTFKEHIGETIVGVFAPRLVAFAIAATTVGLVLGLAELAVPGLALFGLLFVGLVLSQLLSTTIRGLLKTAMYVYATEGRRPAEFDSEALNQMMDAGEQSTRD